MYCIGGSVSQIFNTSITEHAKLCQQVTLLDFCKLATSVLNLVNDFNYFFNSASLSSSLLSDCTSEGPTDPEYNEVGELGTWLAVPVGTLEAVCVRIVSVLRGTTMLLYLCGACCGCVCV